MENSDCECGDEAINPNHCVPNSGKFESAAPLPRSPFRTWMILAIMAVLRCAPTALPQKSTQPLPMLKKPVPELYDGIKRLCGKARIPAVSEVAAGLSDLQERQKTQRGLMGGVTIYTDLPSNRGDGSPDDYSYSTLCFSEEAGQTGLPLRKFVVSRRKGPTAEDILEQWHVYDGRAMTDKQLRFLFPERYSDMRPGCGLEIPGMGCLGAGWEKHEQFEHCPQEDYAELFDTPLCP